MPAESPEIDVNTELYGCTTLCVGTMAALPLPAVKELDEMAFPLSEIAAPVVPEKVTILPDTTVPAPETFVSAYVFTA